MEKTSGKQIISNMIQTKEEKGWYSDGSIAVAHGLSNKCCSMCGAKLSGKYLLVNHYNIYHRGNETQYYKVYCKSCSPQSMAWVLSWLREEKSKKQAQRMLAENQKTAIDKIMQASYINIEDDDGSIIITII